MPKHTHSIIGAEQRLLWKCQYVACNSICSSSDERSLHHQLEHAEANPVATGEAIVAQLQLDLFNLVLGDENESKPKKTKKRVRIALTPKLIAPTPSHTSHASSQPVTFIHAPPRPRNPVRPTLATSTSRRPQTPYDYYSLSHTPNPATRFDFGRQPASWRSNKSRRPSDLTAGYPRDYLRRCDTLSTFFTPSERLPISPTDNIFPAFLVEVPRDFVRRHQIAPELDPIGALV